MVSSRIGDDYDFMNLAKEGIDTYLIIHWEYIIIKKFKNPYFKTSTFLRVLRFAK